MRNIVVIALLLGVLSSVCLYDSGRGYLDPQGPIYLQSPDVEELDLYDGIQLVTYNLKFCEQPSLLTEDLMRLETLKQADVLLFQEVVGVPRRENCVQDLARSLSYYAVFIPAMRHPKNNLDFGNAILSRWPIENVHKIVLPHKHLIWRTHRVALMATIRHPEHPFDVATVHLETLLGSSELRIEQARFVFEQLPSERPVLVSGDWNTFFESDVLRLELEAQQYDLINMTEDIVDTRPSVIGPWKLDHTFGRGFKSWKAGVESEAKGSDHLPLWHELELLDLNR